MRQLEGHDCSTLVIAGLIESHLKKNALAGLDRQGGFAFQQRNLCSMENQFLRFVPRLKSDRYKQKY